MSGSKSSQVMSVRTWLRAGAWAWLALLLYGTLLIPGDPRSLPPTGWCLICGTRGSADLMVNLAMFAPLGMALALGVWSRRGWRVLTLPLGIELIQMALPGRHASLADVVWNMAGAMFGYLALRGGVGMEKRWPGSVSVLWGVGLAAGFLAGGALQRPHLPEGARYFANWNPDIRTVRPYEGAVRSATLDGTPLLSGPLSDTDFVREGLRRGAEIQVVVEGAPVPEDPGLRGIFGLWDEDRREVLLAAVQGPVPVVRSWNWARHLRFQHWAPPADGPLLDLEGETAARLTLDWSADRGACMAVDSSRWCEPRLTPGQFWGMVVPSLGMDHRALTAFWLGALFLPLGLLAWRPGTVAALVILGAVLWALPLVLPVAPMGSAAWAMVVSAVVLGGVIRRGFGGSVSFMQRSGR